MLGCIQPMSSAMINMIFGFFCCAATGTTARATKRSSATLPIENFFARLINFLRDLKLISKPRDKSFAVPITTTERSSGKTTHKVTTAKITLAILRKNPHLLLQRHFCAALAGFADVSRSVADIAWAILESHSYPPSERGTAIATMARAIERGLRRLLVRSDTALSFCRSLLYRFVSACEKRLPFRVATEEPI